MALIFSTNLDPQGLVDEAFLRRMGYKVQFIPCSRDEYVAIWLQVCEQLGVADGQSLADFVLRTFYQEQDVPLLPCHPRDLLRLALDYARYTSAATDETALRWAWQNYFVAEI